MLCHFKRLRAIAPLTRFASQQTRNENSLQYCANIVRQHDYENYLATLLVTKALRSPALVIRAFNAEVARVQDQTTDPQTAAMRLQFWQDSVNSLYSNSQNGTNVPAHPITQELYKVCSSYKLPKRYLERLISSRSGLLRIKHFSTLEDVEKYAENTVSTIYYLLLCVAGVTNVHADHVASHLGKAQGIANTLRSVHVFSHHKSVSLPMDILMKYKVSQESVLRGKDSDNIRNAVFEIASRANSHLQKGRSIEVPKITKQLFLPAIAVERYLNRLQKKNFDIFERSLMLSSPALPINLYWKRIFNKY